MINNKAAIGTAAVAAGAIALGAATMGTSVVVSGALFGFGIGIGMTEASDFADNGRYDTSLRTYAANGVGGAVAGAMLPAVSGLSAIGRIAAYSAIGTTSDVSTQIIGSGSVDWGQAAAGGMKFAAAAMGIEALAVGAGALSNAARNISNKIGMQRFKGFLADETGGVSIGSAGKAAEGTVNTGYRYVSEGELNVIKKTGTIPNTDRAGNLKDVFVSPVKYDTVVDAEKGLQIGKQNPFGVTESPMYRVEFDMNGVKYRYGGNVDSGTGVELITKQSIPADLSKIFKLK